MYPNLYYFFKDVFGIEIGILSIFQMFGLFMAFSFLAAFKVITEELKRKEKEGKLRAVKVRQVINKQISNTDLYINALLYGLLGYKIGGLFTLDFSSGSANVQEYIFSTEGNFIAAVAFAGLGYYLRYRDQQKVKALKEETKEVVQHPWQLMGTITMVAAVSGLLGAKLFHILENLNEFAEDPWGSVFSFSGLTYFGGLICGAAAVLWYVKRFGIHWRYMLDAGGPAMMLAYGIGRMGCHLSGDGDWGIVNTQPKPSWLSFMPDWFWAYNYPNNVLGVCNPYVTAAEQAAHPCTWKETPYLIANVYPTPLWESIACILLFVLMWRLRKHIQVPGAMFCLYLILAGIERYFIEKIRVNNVLDIFGIQLTQAEFLSIIFVVVGTAGWLIFSRYKLKPMSGA